MTWLLVDRIAVLVGLALTMTGTLRGFMKTRKKIAEIHVLVNSHLSALMDQVSTLIEKIPKG